MATSLKAVKKYNAKTYTTISARIRKDLALEFKDVCNRTGISQAEVIKQAMEAFIAQHADNHSKS